MNLLMLTKFYPFGTGEAFIESELPTLARQFERIVIVACEVPPKETRIRPMPENVSARRVPRGARFLDLATGIRHSFFSEGSDLRRADPRCKNIGQRVFLSYFEAKSQRMHRYIAENHFISDIGQRPFILYSYWLFTTARVGTLIAGDRKPACMLTRAHRYDLYAEQNSTGYLPLRGLLLAAYDAVLSCSEDGTGYLRRQFPAYADKIHTAFLGTADHGPGRGSTDGVFRIASCSRIASEKRVDRILDALLLLDQTEAADLRIRWTHIGGGRGRKKLQKRAAQLKNIRAVFLGDIPNRKVLDFYKENPVDLFLNVSSSEGLPVSVMEAISFGIPVLATDAGGTSEIVVDGVTGSLLPPDFTEADLADRIQKAARESPADRDVCRLFWEKHFRAEANYTRLWQATLQSLDERAGH